MEPTKLADFPVESLKQGSRIDILVGEPDSEIVEQIFGPPPQGSDPDPTDIVIVAPPDITWPQLLAALGCFPSVTQAKKNWCHGMKREAEIAYGYEEVSIGKARKIFIFLFKERLEDP